MKREEKIQSEIIAVGKAFETYPTILLNGPATTCLRRIQDAALFTYHYSPQDDDFFRKDQHPDALILDCREVNPEQAREVRDRLSSIPSRLPKRFLVLLRIDRLHNNSAQSLLKLTEEPPNHLRIIMTTDRPWAILPTIHSRSISYDIDPPTKPELEEELKLLGLDDPLWRASICGGVTDVALELEIQPTKEWHKVWSSCVAGSRPGPDFPYQWAEKMQELSEATRISCWSILATLAARQPSSPFWRQIAITAIKERERAIQGRSNKITSATALVHIHAYAKTASKRRT